MGKDEQKKLREELFNLRLELASLQHLNQNPETAQKIQLAERRIKVVRREIAKKKFEEREKEGMKR